MKGKSKLKKKNKDNPPRKKFFILQKMELSSSNIKKFVTFFYISGKRNSEKNFLYFRQWEPEKSSLYFQRWNPPFFSPGFKTRKKNLF